MPIQDDGGRDIVLQVEQRGNGIGNTDYGIRLTEANKSSTIDQLVKIVIAITIFSAASYGEGWVAVNYMALVALLLVYVVAIG
jgi:hypothetical protein